MHLVLTYEPTDEILSLLETLDAQRYSIQSLVPDGLEVLFQERAQYVNAHSSSAIEGNQLGLDDAIAVMSGEGFARGADAMQVAQLNEAYEHAYRLTSDRSTQIDEGTIRALNSVLQKGSSDLGARSRGAYRPGIVVIRDPGGQQTYVAPPAEEVPSLMAHLEEDIERWTAEYSGPVAAALAHFALVSIHPFEDGNGRTARLVADMLLDLTDWSFGRMITVNEAILLNGPAYIEALRSAQGGEFQETVAVERFVVFQLLRLREAADRLQAAMVRLNRVLDVGVSRLGGRPRKGAQGRRLSVAMMYLIAVGPITSSRYATLTACSQATAITDLAVLERAGVVSREGAGRNTRYRYIPGDDRRVDDGGSGP